MSMAQIFDERRQRSQTRRNPSASAEQVRPGSSDAGREVTARGEAAGSDDTAALARELRASQSSCNWVEAAELAARLRECAPAAPIGWLAGAGALSMLQRYNEAEKLLDEARNHFPDAIWWLAQRCWLAR